MATVGSAAAGSHAATIIHVKDSLDSPKVDKNFGVLRLDLVLDREAGNCDLVLGNTSPSSSAIAKVPPTRTTSLSGAQFRGRCYSGSQDSTPSQASRALISPRMTSGSGNQERHVCHRIEQSSEDGTAAARARDKLQCRMRSRRLGYVGAVAPNDLAQHLGKAAPVPIPASVPDSSLTEEFFLRQEDEGIQDFLCRRGRRGRRCPAPTA